MEEVIERLKNAPIYAKVLLAVVLGSVINIYTFMEETPILEEERQQEVQARETARVKFERAKSDAQALTKLELTLKNIREQLSQAKRYLPDEIQMDEILHTTARFCKRYSVDLTRFRPGEEEPSNSQARYAIKPVAVTLQGRFVDIARFFDSMVHLQKIVHLRNIRLIRAEEEQNNNNNNNNNEEQLDLFRLTPEQRQRYAERNTKVEAQAEIMLFKSEA